jgi:hypothetical protein
VVLDNDVTHNHQRVRAWLATLPGSSCTSGPTYGSWRNVVEVVFAIIER